MAKVVIVGLGKYLPSRIVDNKEVIKILAKNGITTTESGNPLTAEGISNLLGIDTRRWANPKQNTSHLARHAILQALKRGGVKKGEIDIIRIGSSSPESFFPSTACELLYGINGPRIEAADCLAACTSSLYAMVDVKRALLDEPDYDYGLAIGAEVLATRMTDWHDLNSNLWCDGAGAALFKKVPDNETESGIICSILGSDPSAAPLTRSIGKGTRPKDAVTKPNIYLKGHDVQKFVLQIVPELIFRTLDKANRTISLDDIDLVILHQANGRIFKKISEKSGIPLEKFFVNVNKYGNVSSAAILIALCEAVEEGRVKKGSVVLLIAFGGGLTYGSILLRL